ncbi:MAG TPA: mannosyltransferase family protein [Ktedonobacterales bacterium]|nr:mannosyltransferase family protein [Ktedonobacterales bacterium]
MTTRNRLVLWQQFDANWYIHIAQNGYDSHTTMAFYPLYPMLIRAVTFVMGDSHSLLAAMLIANAGSLVAFIGLSLLAVHDSHNDSAAPRAVRALAAYPFAFFLFAPYTEGLFLGFAVVAFLCARRGAWKWAAFWVFLAGATRPTGAILVLALLWEFGSQHGWWQRERWRRDYWQPGRWREVSRGLLQVKPMSDFIFVIGAMPLALGLFVLYSDKRWGLPLEPFQAQQHYWGRTVQPIWQTLAELMSQLASAPIGGRVQALILLDLGAVVLCAVVTLIAIRTIPFAYVIYMAGLIYISVATPILSSPSIIDSAARFMLVAFPVWLTLGRWFETRPWLDMFVVFVGISLQVIFALLFMSGFGIQ